MILLRPFKRLRLTLQSRSIHSTSSHLCSSSSKPISTPITPKLRFAPSPTGFLHLGGLRTALYNHLLARKMGGKWVLRIEDTDQTRYVAGAVESLLKTLKWAKLDFDEGPGKDGGNGPYFQSQRKHIYDKHLEPLLQSGKAYHCFCTPERLAKTRKSLQKLGRNEGYDRKCAQLTREQIEEKLGKGEKSIVRFKSSSHGMVQKDLIYDEIKYESLPKEDFVLRKSDGLPTYHFANVVDDYEMGITHVLRGEEWLPSTPKHLQLYEALNLPKPLFAHLPLLINPDGSKLSKRTGDVAVEQYIEKGYESSALLNFVALLGWSPQSHSSSSPSTPLPPSSTTQKPAHPESTTDLLPLNQLIESFSLDAVNKNRATLQGGKLDWLNRGHVRVQLFDQSQGSDERRRELAGRVKEVVKSEIGEVEERDKEYYLAVVDALKDRLHTVKDIPSLGRYFFVEPDYDTPVSRKMYSSMDPKVYRDTLLAAIPIISSLPSSLFSLSLSPSSQDLEHSLLVSLSSISIASPSPSSPIDSRQKASQVMSPLRHALTGQKVGASVPGCVRVLGRDKVKERFEKAVKWSEGMEKVA